MVHDVLRHLVQPVVAGDEMVFLPQHFFKLFLLILVQPRILDGLVDLLVQLRVRDLQLLRPVLVVERHRRPVLHGLLEIIHAHVIAEDLTLPLLPGDQRGSRECYELRIRQRRAHVHRQRIVLAAVRLIRQHDDVVPLREHRRQRPRLRAELME
ncbi:MAG: hypothetical protein QNL68_12100 [Akkermansiaceae bacterium]